MNTSSGKRFHPGCFFRSFMTPTASILLLLGSLAAAYGLNLFEEYQSGIQWAEPKVVNPGPPGGPPSDAIVLFDGKDLSQWEGAKEGGIEDGCINIVKSGELRSKQQFGDCQLHMEWATPAVADGNAMKWGNSGVFLMDSFEVQIIESNATHIYADGIAAAVYGQTPPLVNASRKPGQWQCFDIVFTAPRFDGEKLRQPAYVTVFHNGVLAQYHQTILGPTAHKMFPQYTSHETEGPIRLQQHGSAVRLRNIWVRPLQLDGSDHSL